MQVKKMTKLALIVIYDTASLFFGKAKYALSGVNSKAFSINFSSIHFIINFINTNYHVQRVRRCVKSIIGASVSFS